jgi:uridylate kinase
MKKRWVISLGGSILLSEKNHQSFLLQLQRALAPTYKNHVFVIVCGGGKIAREYIQILRENHESVKNQSLAGIRATRTNAEFVMEVLGKKANEKLPFDMKSVKNELAKNKLVVCGALRYRPNQTSDSTAAQLANYLGAEFINITNVKGLYTADPRKNKKAVFIPFISWEAFEKKAKEHSFKPGQHFVLDQKAAELIHKKKITTYVVGPSAKNIKRLIEGKKFIGTTISC